MLKVRLAVASLGLAMILPAASTLLAQTASVMPAAPLPSQILTAKKVFISNADAGTMDNYNQFYAAIKTWGRYELVSAPASADLVFEISFTNQITSVSGSKESGCDSFNTSTFKLVLLDPGTRITLWTLTENIKPYARQKTGEINTEDAMNKLIENLKALTAHPAASQK